MLFTYPNAWYLRLFGEVEASVRFPFLLHLTVLHAAILALAEHGGVRIRATVVVALWLSLLAFAIAMAFSATYNPYSADIALPGVQDTLLMVCFLGWVHAFLHRDWGWTALFAALTYASLPSGLLLMGFWLLAELAVSRPRGWHDVGRAGLLLAGCLLLGWLGTRAILAVSALRPGGEYGLTGILRYFAFLQFTDWRRFLFVLVASGIFPALALLRWRAGDRVGRTVTLATILYFAFFFVQAQTALHHYVPAMIGPLVVAARLEGSVRSRPPLGTRAWLAAAVIAIALSLPASFQVRREGRLVGATISEKIGTYSVSDPAVLSASTLLSALWPYDWNRTVPDSSYGGSPLVWNHYARHGTLDAGANYFLMPADQPPQEGLRLVARDSLASLYVRSVDIWQAHRDLRPPTPPGSPVYFIPRGILFRSVPLENGPTIIDVVAVLEGLGVNMTPILRRLGVRP
jgi:hypothetical protein